MTGYTTRRRIARKRMASTELLAVVMIRDLARTPRVLDLTRVADDTWDGTP